MRASSFRELFHNELQAPPACWARAPAWLPRAAGWFACRHSAGGALRESLERFGRSWPQFFLKCIVSHPAATCAVPGMARPQYVEDNLRMERFIDGI